MTNALSELFSGSAFAETLGWTPAMLALQAISGLLIAVAYLIIPATIWRLLRRRRDLDRDARRVAGVFIVFIVAAAAFHIASVAALWLPVYGLQGTLKAVTAIAALATAVAFRQRIPQLLGLPSPRDMARANLALAQTNASLETTIAWRTHELERVSQRFEQALSCSDITVYTQDADLRFTWIHNPRLGLTAADVIGRRTADFLRPEATDESLPLKLRALESGLTVSDTIAIATPSEGTLYMDMTVSPTIDQEGEIDGVLCTVVDVTEKRLFEVRLASMAAELATASHRFELALDNSGISVFEQTPDLRYTYMYNPPAGTEPEDYLDRIDTEIFPERELRKILPPKGVFSRMAAARPWRSKSTWVEPSASSC